MAEYQLKDSGVDWLGDIPEHLFVSQIKYLLEFHDNRRIPLSSTERGQMQFKKYDYYGASGVIDAVDNYIFDESMILLGEDGANLVTRSKPLAFLAHGKYWVNNHAHILKPKYGSLRYWAYLLEDYDYSLYVTGAAQPKLNSQNLGKLKVIYTKKSKEQKAIADYLDKACKQIDKTLEIKQQQLEKLESYRKSIIHEAVTKGLDESVTLKDSGVEWLGDIPEHWIVKRIKDLVALKSGDGITSLQINKEEKYPVYGGNGLRGYTNRYTHNGYFVLIGRQGALCGNINYACGKFFATEHAVVATPYFNQNTFWLGELFTSMNLNQYSNAAAQPGLAVEKIKNLKIPYPPKEEIEAIADYLDKACEKIDQTKALIEQQIKTLTNYRKSLIHECVTGKKRVYFD